MTLTFYEPFLRVPLFRRMQAVGGGHGAAPAAGGGAPGAHPAGAGAGSSGRGAISFLLFMVALAILIGANTLWGFVPSNDLFTQIVYYGAIIVFAVMFVMDSSEGKAACAFFAVVVLVFNIIPIAVTTVSIFMFIAYAVVFILLLPYIMGFLIDDGMSYADRIHNSTYLTLTAVQLAVFWLMKSGVHLFPAIDPFLNSGILYPLWLLNAWGLYILFTHGSASIALRFLRFALVVILVIMALIQMFTFLSANHLNVSGNNYGIVSLKTVFDTARSSLSKIWTSVPGVYEDFKLQLNKSIAVATGTYYEGQVEDNKNEPLGVFIKNLRPIDKVQLANQKITVLAEISGQSFRDTIDVRVACVAKSSNGTLYPGRVEYVNPNNEPIQIVLKGTETVFCYFGEGGDLGYPTLPAGHYDVQMSATFPFQTWAYITYTFVDQGTYRNYYAQGKDINAELSIEKNPVAVYTAGPVSLGLASQDQPFPLSTTPGDTNVFTFGATVDNAWSQGTIDRVKSFVLKVPQPFVLSYCIPKEITNQVQDTADPTYTAYSFNVEDPHIAFTTTTCRVTLTGDDAQKMLMTSAKPQRTFVGQAQYTYVLTQNIGIDVR